MQSYKNEKKENFKNIIENKNIVIPRYLQKNFNTKLNSLLNYFNSINLYIEKKNIEKILLESLRFIQCYKFRNSYKRFATLEYLLKNIIELSIMNIYDKNYCQTYINFKLDNIDILNF